MKRIQMFLSTGFEGDDVEILVNGKRSLLVQNVRTQLLSGLAATASIEIPDQGGTVEVRIPAKSLSASFDLPGSGVEAINVERGGNDLRIYRFDPNTMGFQ